MMCRRCHRNTRWLGVASHRRSIGTPEKNNATAIPAGLYASPMREKTRSSGFPMRLYASSVLTGANGGDAR
jgi:hypothetical protein